MKILVKVAAAAGLLALAACNNSATENKADALRESGGNGSVESNVSGM